MLPGYVLIVDIISNPTINEEQFRAQVQPCLNHLSALKGAFDRTTCKISFRPPDVQSSIPDNQVWSVRAVVMISVGAKRGECLIQLYDSIMTLLMYELSDFLVKGEVKKLEFS